MDIWRRETGLPSSAVSSVAQTPDGYLWIGTQNGLSRYDGVRFVNFEPRNTPELWHARVYALFVDSRGTLWINTYDGSLTSWRNGIFTHEWQGSKLFEVTAFFERTNEIVFASSGGGLVLRRGDWNQPGEWSFFVPSHHTTGVSYHEDRTGVLWYRTRDRKVERLQGTNDLAFPEGSGLEGQTVNCVNEDRHRNIWLGTDKELCMWNGDRIVDQTPTNGESPLSVTFLFCTSDGGCWTIANGRLRKSLNRRWVAESESWANLFGSQLGTPTVQAYEDRDGGVWFRHTSQGIFHVSPGGSMSRISSAEGLPGDRVDCWMQDREGGIWVGVDHGGLVHLRKKRVKVLGAEEGLPTGPVASVCQDSQGSIWLGTTGVGLNRLQDGRVSQFELPDGDSAKFFYSVVPDGPGRLWLSAGEENLYVMEDGLVKPAPWHVHGVKVMLVDHLGNLWIGTRGGLNIVKNGQLTVFGGNEGLDFTDIRSLAEDSKGKMWAGGGNGTLYHYFEGRFDSYRADDTLVGEAIWSLLPDIDGTVYAGTSRGGLLRFKDGRFTRFTSADGLPSDAICQMLDDGKGNLWIGSLKGIFRVSKSALDEFAASRKTALQCVTYGLEDGLPTLECFGGYQPSACRARDGSLWFAMFKGAVVISPDEAPLDRPPAPVAVVEDLLVDGKSLVNKSQSRRPGMKSPESLNAGLFRTNGVGGVEVLPGKHQFEFRYTAPSFVAPEKVNFRYKLEGLDDVWVESGERRTAQYPYLPAGDYRFRVSACDNSGVWSASEAGMNLSVLPHLWERWWFRGAAAATLLAGLIATVRVVSIRKLNLRLERLEHLQAVERERTRIARDLHDDLGATVTQVGLMLEELKLNGLSPEDMKRQSALISGRVLTLARDLDAVVWSVNPGNDSLNELFSYLSQFFLECLRRTSIRARLNVLEDVSNQALAPEARHHLFLLVKEAVNNVIKHSRATEATLTLSAKDGKVEIIVEDNGRGFSTDMPADQKRQGLLNMRSRIRELAGDLIVNSAPGGGTAICIRVSTLPELRKPQLRN